MSPTRRSFVKAALGLPIATAFAWPEITTAATAHLTGRVHAFAFVDGPDTRGSSCGMLVLNADGSVSLHEAMLDGQIDHGMFALPGERLTVQELAQRIIATVGVHR